MKNTLVTDIAAGLVIGLALVPLAFFAIQIQQNSTAQNAVVQAQVQVDEQLVTVEDPVQIPTNKPEVKGEIETVSADLPKEILLDVPYFEQLYTLSCEAASMQMALAYRGISIDQAEVIENEYGISGPLTPTKNADGSLSWGDPDEGFVGNYKGFFWNPAEGLRGATGWGVNNGPVAKVANKYRDGSFEKSGATSKEIMRYLADDKPVIFWHVRDDASRKEEVPVITPSGRTVTFKQNHVALVVGYSTDSNEQTTFTVQDPEYGTYQISQEDFDRQRAKYDNDIVVIA